MSSDIFLKKDYRFGLNTVLQIWQEEIDSKLWDKWISLYPNMSGENFISFDEFKEMHKPKKPLNKKKIDDKVSKIDKAYKKAVKN